ncbi:MAG: shikimate dehydrogenase [Myxococcales bacterium]
MKPRRFALLGDPVGQALSPAVHRAAYRALGMPHTYRAIRATPGELPRYIRELRDGVYDGFNLTVPHKTRILELVDAVDRSAAFGAVANTLVAHEDGTLVAYNTAAPALAEELTRLAPDLVRTCGERDALVLGTGGAARSAVVALALELGVRRIFVRARAFASVGAGAAFQREMSMRLEQAEVRVEVVHEPWRAIPSTDEHVSFVVQGTRAGMAGMGAGIGGEAVAGVVTWEALPPRAAVLDVVYSPTETSFVRVARSHGIRATNGVGMLARQGALAFELWLGVPAPYNAMLTALV